MPASDYSDLYGDAFNALLLAYLNNKNSKSKPNTYPVPLTPGQQWLEDEKRRVYESGGTDAQKTAGSAARQFLSGMQSGPSSFEFMSPELKGKAFGGGIKFPT